MTPRPRPRAALTLWAARSVLVGLCWLAVGCGGAGPNSGSSSATPASGESQPPVVTPSVSAAKPRVALIMKSLANEFFKTMAEGGKQHQAAHSGEYELIVNGIKDERDLARQVGLVDEMIAQGVQAIVIAPADSKALVSACKRAQEAGVVVVNIDNKLDDQVKADQKVTIPFVGPDNQAGAKKVGDFLATQLARGDHVALLEGIKTAFNGQQRKLGFEAAMKAAGVTIVESQSAQWEIDPANRLASAMLVEHPELRALLCCNDNMALGALAAVKAAGKEKQVRIVGYDGITAVRQAIRDGAVLATADQHADRLAVFGIEYALGMIKGGKTPADQATPVDLVTAETLR